MPADFGGELRSINDAARSTSALPSTITSLTRDLRNLGVQPGMNALVHSSLSALGYVVGSAHAVVEAMLAAFGDSGTIMMPTFSGDLSDPGKWENPPVPELWWPVLREHMPAFDPLRTGTREMGRINELFRHYPNVRRGYHPQVSFAAIGPNTDVLLDHHDLASHLGELSPLARLYDLDGWILMCGTGHANNTSLHLSEHRSTPASARRKVESAPIFRNGERQWVTYETLDTDDDDFAEIGAAFAASTGLEKVGPLGSGKGRLIPMRALVDFGAAWMDAHRH